MKFPLFSKEKRGKGISVDLDNSYDAFAGLDLLDSGIICLCGGINESAGKLALGTVSHVVDVDALFGESRCNGGNHVRDVHVEDNQPVSFCVRKAYGREVYAVSDVTVLKEVDKLP